MSYRIANWDKFQGYDKKGPKWLKLHVDIINKQEWITLPTVSRALLPVLWIVASSQGTDGEIPSDVKILSILCHLEQDEVLDGIDPLVAAGFLIDTRENNFAGDAQIISGEERREEKKRDRDRAGRVKKSELERLSAEPEIRTLCNVWIANLGGTLTLGLVRAVQRCLAAGYDSSVPEQAILALRLARESPDVLPPKSFAIWCRDHNSKPGFVLRPETVEDLASEYQRFGQAPTQPKPQDAPIRPRQLVERDDVPLSDEQMAEIRAKRAEISGGRF